MCFYALGHHVISTERCAKYANDEYSASLDEILIIMHFTLKKKKLVSPLKLPVGLYLCLNDSNQVYSHM